jgi:hypothetical protein
MLKQMMLLQKFFQYGDLFESANNDLRMNEEIVLPKLEKPQSVKTGKLNKKNVYAQRSSGIILPEYRLPTGWMEYAAAADVGQREYIYKDKYPWSGSYTVLERDK